MDDVLIEVFNTIYDKYGFDGVLEEIKGRLLYGTVTKKDDDLYRISTGGWSDDEEILHSLTSLPSKFGYFHYVGVLRGGAYYFSEKNHNNFEIINMEKI